MGESSDQKPEQPWPNPDRIPPLGTAPDVPTSSLRVEGPELTNEVRVQYVFGRNPGALLRTVAFPVHQILPGPLHPAGIQYPMDGISRLASNDTRRRGRSVCRDKGRKNNRF